MPNYIATTRADIESPVVLLHITYTDNSVMTLTNNTSDLVNNGVTYNATGFVAPIQAQPETGLPLATITIPKVSGTFIVDLEAKLNVVMDAQVIHSIVFPSDPNTAHYQNTFTITSCRITNKEATMSTGLKNITNIMATPYRYTRDNMPGIFE